MLTMTTSLAFLKRLWTTDRVLTATALVMSGALLAALLGLWLDPRAITGAPAWLKPAKFAVSTAIYSLTVAWLFGFLPRWPRLRRIVGRTTASVFLLEVGIIFMQAWRGTTSHFNAGSPLDAVLGITMGVAIGVQTIASVALAVALWRQQFADTAAGWAIRLGMTLTIAGAMTGGLMTQPTQDQLANARASRQMPVVGAHSVGGPDGGPEIPGIHWNRDRGDLRVPHFAGLHAVQALPLLAFALPRAWSSRRRARVVQAAAMSYGALVALLLWQALEGESIAQPGASTVAASLVWLTSTTAAFCASLWLTIEKRELHTIEFHEERHRQARV
jgi:hypothetical protein